MIVNSDYIGGIPYEVLTSTSEQHPFFGINSERPLEKKVEAYSFDCPWTGNTQVKKIEIQDLESRHYFQFTTLTSPAAEYSTISVRTRPFSPEYAVHPDFKAGELYNWFIRQNQAQVILEHWETGSTNEREFSAALNAGKDNSSAAELAWSGRTLRSLEFKPVFVFPEYDSDAKLRRAKSVFLAASILPQIDDVPALAQSVLANYASYKEQLKATILARRRAQI